MCFILQVQWGGCILITILPLFYRIYKVPTHLLWTLWDGIVLPMLKMLAVFCWPRSSIRWPFWRLVFCAIWQDKIQAAEQTKADCAPNGHWHRHNKDGTTICQEEVTSTPEIQATEQVQQQSSLSSPKVGLACQLCAQSVAVNLSYWH
jgi:hypothetical protein